MRFTQLTTLSLFIALGFGCSGGDKRSNSDGGSGSSGGSTGGGTTGGSTGGTLEEPIDDDEVVTLETGATASEQTLIFESSGNKSAGRQLTEYLLVVRASESSCVRLKFSSDNTDDEASKSDTDNISGADQSCAPAEPATEAASALSLTDFQKMPKAGNNLGFNLVNDSLCDARIFRMESENNSNSIKTKTARLAFKQPVTIAGSTQYVRIWVDEEIKRITCDANGMVDHDILPFAPLWIKSPLYANTYDQFTNAHLSALASNVASSYTTLSQAYGEVSDVDGNDGVDVFISPDVNRTKLFGFRNPRFNNIEPQNIFKPEDLAAFSSEDNPMGNEGEIIYMWAPDTAALYKTEEFISSSSLTSNYARGFIGFQLSSLYFAKERYLNSKGTIPNGWLRNAVGYLFADYVGGNDYGFFPKSYYLSSQSHRVSLTDFTSSAGNDEFDSLVYEQEGLQLMFGWYLHTRICGQTLEPCAQLYDLISSEGGSDDIAAIEALTGKSFNELLDNFGVSIGAELADDPSIVRAFWDVSDISSLPEKPFDLPKADFINASLPTKFVDSALDGSSHPVIDIQSIAGPFTSRHMELFQPVYPDNELDLELAKNSVTYILLTGLIDDQNKLKAFLGNDLNVTILPLGERSTASLKADGARRTRFVHNEKVGENTILDTRPVNLTSMKSSFFDNPNIGGNQDFFKYPLEIHYKDQEYPELNSTKGTAVTESRELWIVGEIENGTVEGDHTVGDTDSYVIEVNPCLDSTDATCQTKDHYLYIQYTGRKSEKKLDPMFLVGNTDISTYRGAQIFGDVQTFAPVTYEAEVAPVESTADYFLLCPNSSLFPPLAAGKCATGGSVKAGDKDQFLYDADSYILSNGRFGDTIDNFLYSSPKGFPFTTASNFVTNESEFRSLRSSLNEFTDYEVMRQFYSFTYKPLQPYDYKFYLFDYDRNIVDLLSTDRLPIEVDNLEEAIELKSQLTDFVNDGANPAEEPAEFIALCEAFEVTGCEQPFSNAAQIQNSMISFFNNSYIDCVSSTFCNIDTLNDDPPGIISSWNIASINVSSASRSWSSYYKPSSSNKQGIGESVCAGGVFDVSAPHPECFVSGDAPYVQDGSDVREQFATSDFKNDCYFDRFVNKCNYELSEFEIAGDEFSLMRKVDSNPLDFRYNRQTVTGDFSTPNIPMRRIDNRVGEISDKMSEIHSMYIKIPASGTHGSGSSLVNLILGGLDNSEGQYLLRARVVDFSREASADDLY